VSSELCEQRCVCRFEQHQLVQAQIAQRGGKRGKRDPRLRWARASCSMICSAHSCASVWIGR
jgi:hypothetical protein